MHHPYFNSHVTISTGYSKCPYLLHLKIFIVSLFYNSVILLAILQCKSHRALQLMYGKLRSLTM